MRRLLILGSTGSIGQQALEIVAGTDEFELVGLAANRDWEALARQARDYGVQRIGLADPQAAARAGAEFGSSNVFAGPEGLARLITTTQPELVLNAIVGSAGLGPTIVTLAEGIDLALANKESLVVGGELVMQLGEATGARILPVDSEHSALFQLINGERQAGAIDRLILTASGGPFRGRQRDQLTDVSVAEALAHPTWSMGGKITIDSATLMNKGLEVIEAHHLFAMPYQQIDVLIHPQSIIHSLIELCDGAQIAHLGHPDMRVPIAYALHYPERVDVPTKKLDLAALGALTFARPDAEAFPCLALACEAGAAGGSAPCVLNAANEVAVQAFLTERIGFLDIPRVIQATLDAVDSSVVTSFEDLYEADRRARATALDTITALPVVG